MYKDYLISSSQEQTAEWPREVWTATHVRYNTSIKAFSEDTLIKIIDKELYKRHKLTQELDAAIKKWQEIINKLDATERLKDKDPETKQKTNAQIRQKYWYVWMRQKYGAYHERLMDSM